MQISSVVNATSANSRVGVHDESTSDKTVTLASLEHKIVKFFFKESKDDACRKHFGLEQPMWAWTHHSGTSANCFETECMKVTNLLHWLVINCHVDPAEITVVAPTELFKKVKQDFKWKVARNAKRHNNNGSSLNSPVSQPGPPSFPAVSSTAAPQQSETGETAPTTSNTTHNHNQIASLDLVVFVALEKLVPNAPLPEKQTQLGIISFGGLPPSSTVKQFTNPSAGMRHAVQNAKDALIILCDAAWMFAADLASTPQLVDTWCPIAEYLRRELGSGRPARISRDTIIPRGTPPLKLATLIGSKLPVCCPRHLYERALRSGRSAMDDFCRQTCLFPFACGNTGHVCVEPCHDVSEHRCPYPCVKPLRCGHSCRMTCSEPCDCLHDVTKPLSCSHRVAAGFNPETQETAYRVITHEFKGACVEANLPCRIDVPVVCAHCFGDFKAPCAQVTAHGHTHESPTIVCPDCVRRERVIRLQVRQELVEQLAENKKELRRAMKKELSRYKSMMEGGFYQVGQRVYLNDVSALMEPYEADFDESVKFEDFNAPDFHKRMEGIHGIVKASMTDITMDVGDIQCLIEIPNGLHILASGNGLQSVRALCSSAATSGTTLMLTGPKGTSSAEGNDARSSFWGSLRPLVGSLVHILHPVNYMPVSAKDVDPTNPQTQPSCDPVKLVDVVGRILDEDSAQCAAMGEAHVKVEITLPFGNSFVTTNSFDEAATVEETSRKRGREGQDEEEDPTTKSEIKLVVSAPLSSLDIVQLFKRDILISDRTKQLLEPEELIDFYDICEMAVKKKVPADVRKKLRSVGIRDYPSAEGEAFEILDIINYPFDVCPQLVIDSGDGGLETRHGQHVDDRGFLTTKQPHALLISRSFFDHMRVGIPKKRVRSRQQRNSSMQVSTPVSVAEREFPTRCEVAVVPLLFAGVDEEAEAERKLEKETLKKLQEISAERYQELCDNLAFQNEDARFQKEQKLPNRTQEQVDKQTAEALQHLVDTARLAEEEDQEEVVQAPPPAAVATGVAFAATPVAVVNTQKAKKFPPVVAYSMPHPLKPKHVLSAMESRFAHLPQPLPQLKVTMQRKKASLLAKQANSVVGATAWCTATNVELLELAKLDKTYVSTK